MAAGYSPGRKRGDRDNRDHKPAKRATEIHVAPLGLKHCLGALTPGLPPGATDMPPANAGSLPAANSAAMFPEPNVYSRILIRSK
jgi:hypothetical protein